MKKEKHIVNKTYGNHQLARYIDVYEVSANRCHSVPESGYKGTEATLVDEPAWNEKFSSYSITGATLTGNNFILNNDVTAQANYETAKNLTLQTDGHGSIAANRNSGFIGDQVTLSNTADARYGLSGYSITGATLTGNQFNFIGNDVTAKAWFSAVPYTLTLQTDGNGTLTATKITGNPGDTVTLTPTYNTYYRFSGYTVTGGSINSNTFTFGDENATAKAWFKTNPFTATGTFEIGVYTTAKNTTKNIPLEYAIHGSHTGDVPNSWYSTSNRWKVNNASAYSITINSKMMFSLSLYAGNTAAATGAIAIGSTAVATGSSANSTPPVKFCYYNKTTASNVQNVYYARSGKLYASTDATAGYNGSAQTEDNIGSWTATGYAP